MQGGGGGGFGNCMVDVRNLVYGRTGVGGKLG